MAAPGVGETQTPAAAQPPSEDAAPAEESDTPGVGEATTPAAAQAPSPPPEQDAAAEDQPASQDAGEKPEDDGKPALGPVIVGVAKDPPPRPPAPQRERPQRPRRRRLSAAEKHRRAFFARLSELRRAAQSGEELPEDETAEASGEQPEAPPEQVSEPEQAAAEAPAAEEQPAAVEQAAEAEQPAAEEPAPEPQQQRQRSAPPPPVDRPRLLAAIDRVGGPDAVREALRPQQDEQGKPLKWAASCCEAARGAKPGDPAYTAWLRLAATPVREVKGLVDDRPADDRRGRGRGRGRDGGRPQRDGDRDRGRGGRGGRGERANREDLATHGRDEAFRPSVRIVTAEDAKTRREREKAEKAEREAKRQAARERLSKFGY